MFNYHGHKIEVLAWEASKPWPDKISFDGKELVYIEWENLPSGQTIYYHESGELLRIAVKRSAFETARMAEAAKLSGSRIKDLRTNKGMTQKMLAAETGINIRQIQKIESGEIQIGNITLTNAKRLANAFGITIESLLD